MKKVFDYYDNNEIFSEGYIKDSKLTGKWTFYHPNGKVLREGHYQDDIPIGEWKVYYINGQLKSITMGGYIESIRAFRDGIKLIQWNSISGLVLVKNGFGSCVELYENGKIQTTIDFVDGYKNGVELAYARNGVMTGKRNWKNGVRNNKSEGWNDDGILQYVIHYKEDQEDGEYVMNYEDGRPMEKGTVIKNTTYVDKFWDSKNNLVVNNGNGTRIITFGLNIYQQKFKDGILIEEVRL